MFAIYCRRYYFVRIGELAQLGFEYTFRRPTTDRNDFRAGFLYYIIHIYYIIRVIACVYRAHTSLRVSLASNKITTTAWNLKILVSRYAHILVCALRHRSGGSRKTKIRNRFCELDINHPEQINHSCRRSLGSVQ